MRNTENQSLSAELSAVSELSRAYKNRCQNELPEVSDDPVEEHKNHTKRLQILDDLICTSGLQPNALVQNIIRNLGLHPTPWSASMAEDICQWLLHKHRKDGPARALQLREFLVKNQLANPVTLFNLAHQKMLEASNRRDVVEAHQFIELVLQRLTKPSPLRVQALIQSAMNFVDGVAVAVDLKKAHSRLVEAAQSGSPEAAYNLALFYSGRFHAGPSPYTDLNLAACFYEFARRQGHLAAQTNLSLLNIENLVHCSDPDWGWDQLHEAAQKGDQTAQACINELSVQ